VPHDDPSGAFIANLHTEVPEVQSTVFFTQGKAGSEHSLPAAHMLQEPA
jgi:hypothetical protein